MNDRSQSDRVAAPVVAVLLILTAWGNAVAMLAVSVLGLALGVLFFRKSLTKGPALAATLGFLLVIAIALIMLLR